MTSLLQINHLRTQYKEVRSALLTLKERYKRRKSENERLQQQLTAFRKLVNKQCIQIKAAEGEISRLEEIL